MAMRTVVVPANQVGQMVQSFITDYGAKQVTAQKRAQDENWTVTATVPD